MKLSLQQKLALSKRPNYVTLFFDEAFVKAYNESAYLLTKLIGRELKPKVYKMKHKPYDHVIMVSLPHARILNYLPELKKTLFGYELQGEFAVLPSDSAWQMWNQFYCGLSQ